MRSASSAEGPYAPLQQLFHTPKARLYPSHAAKASMSVKRSNKARGISTISGFAGDLEKV